MKTESMGEVFLDGRIVNLDMSSIDELNQNLEIVKSKKENIINKINTLLKEV